jgi:hypothetical protein
MNAFDGWNCAIAMNFEPGTLNFERDRRLERFELFERLERHECLATAVSEV